MKIKESKELLFIAKSAHKTVEDVSNELINSMLVRELINEDSYGGKLLDCISRDVRLSEIVHILQDVGIDNVDYRHYESLCDCELIGDFNCEVCGGRMEIVEEEYTCTGGDGYMQPKEYTPIYTKKVCVHCRHTITE